jgi:hypothetical protein
MDPLGAEVGTHDPYLYTPNPTYGDVHGDAPMYVEGGDPLDLKAGCGTIDGMPTTCSEIIDSLANGSAVAEVTTGAGRPRQVNGNNLSLGAGGISVWVPWENDHEVRQYSNGLTLDIEWVNTGGDWETIPFGVGFGSASGNRARPQAPQTPYDPRTDFRDYATQLLNDDRTWDCLKLSLLIYKAGQVTGGDADKTISILLEGLTELSTLRPPRQASDPNFRVGVDGSAGRTFGQTGFRQDFQDQESPNQVRHFIAYLALGYRSPQNIASDAIAWGRDPNNQPDKDLGYAGIRLGSRYRGNYKQLANDTWNGICGQTATNLQFP